MASKIQLAKYEDVTAVNTSLTTHTGNKSNPHGVTKSQIGLGNVLNVASYSKTEVDNKIASENADWKATCNQVDEWAQQREQAIVDQLGDGTITPFKANYLDNGGKFNVTENGATTTENIYMAVETAIVNNEYEAGKNVGFGFNFKGVPTIMTGGSIAISNTLDNEKYHCISFPDVNGDNYQYYFPHKNGTVALTSDLNDIYLTKNDNQIILTRPDGTTQEVTDADTNTTYDLSAAKNKSNGSVTLNLTAGGSGSGTDSVTIKGTGATTVTTDANGVITINSTDTDTNTNTWRKVQLNGTDKLTTGTSTKPLNIKAGTNMSITESDGTFTFNATDTNTNYYHTTGTWDGLIYTATAHGGAGVLSFAIPTGTSSTTVAAGNHTHTTSLASDNGTSSITLSHGGKYKLTAGGKSVIFTMPSDNNTTYNLVGANGTTGLIKNGSSVTSTSGYTACPIISGVPYYKDTNTTYSEATTSSSGLMSKYDKTCVNFIQGMIYSPSGYVYDQYDSNSQGIGLLTFRSCTDSSAPAFAMGADPENDDYYIYALPSSNCTLASTSNIGDGTLTIKYGSSTKGTFTANSSSSVTATIPQLYFHHINVIAFNSDLSAGFNFKFILINSSSTKITSYATVGQYLYQKGFTSANNQMPCSGAYNYTGKINGDLTVPIVGVWSTSSSGTSMTIAYLSRGSSGYQSTSVSTSTISVYDTVVTISS